MAINLGSAVGYLMLDSSGFTGGLKTAQQYWKGFLDNTNSAETRISSLGSAFTAAGTTMTKKLTLPLVGVGSASVKTASAFEASMSQVQATMGIAEDSVTTLNGSVVNTKESLGDLAKELGASTKFSASEAALAINNLAMAGYDTQKIYDTLPTVLNLASAGCIDLDYATQLVANGLNVMGLDTSYAEEMTDKMAVTAANAYGSVSDFGEGLMIAGAQASLCNVNLTDTYTALGILGDNGISASEGGTYLRNALKNLYTPTDTAAKKLEELGVVTANEDGTLRDFQAVLQDLGKSLDGLTEEDRVKAMADIFDTRTISAANALIANSTERWDELSAAIDDSANAAGEMADTQLDNLPGKLTILKSSLEGAAIAFGEILLPVVKDLTALVQNAVDWVNNLSDSQKETIVTILEIVAALGPILLLVGNGIKLISNVISVVKGLKTAFTAINAVMAANPILLVVAAIAALVAAFIYLWNNCEEFRQFWINLWDGIKGKFEEAKANVIANIERLKEGFSDLKEAIKEAWENAKETVVNKVTEIVNSVRNMGERLKEAAKSAFNKVKDGAVDAWLTLTTWVDEKIGSLKETFEGISLFDAGKSLLDSWLNGLKSVWSSISSWVSEKTSWITSMFSGAKSGISSIKGSAATGMDYILSDGVWNLHEGERVLSKEENEEYSKNKSSGGDTFNFYSPKPISPVEAAKQLKKAKRQLALGME